MKKVFLSLLLVCALAPISAMAANAANTVSCSTIKDNGLNGVVACVVSVFNVALTLMVSASIVVIVWGAFKMIYNEEGRAAGRETVVYGIIGLFVMISIWGFVNILDNTFKLSSQGPLPAPKIQIQ